MEYWITPTCIFAIDSMKPTDYNSVKSYGNYNPSRDIWD